MRAAIDMCYCFNPIFILMIINIIEAKTVKFVTTFVIVLILHAIVRYEEALTYADGRRQ